MSEDAPPSSPEPACAFKGCTIRAQFEIKPLFNGPSILLCPADLVNFVEMTAKAMEADGIIKRVHPSPGPGPAGKLPGYA